MRVWRGCFVRCELILLYFVLCVLLDADAALFDAAQYTFFGKGAVDEVELGGFEDEDGPAPGVEGGLGGEDELNEYHLFDKDEVNY